MTYLDADPGYDDRDTYSRTVDAAALFADWHAVDDDTHPDLDPLPPRPAWRPNQQGALR